jgi:hypothetical protein
MQAGDASGIGPSSGHSKTNLRRQRLFAKAKVNGGNRKALNHFAQVV